MNAVDKKTDLEIALAQEPRTWSWHLKTDLEIALLLPFRAPPEPAF